MAGHLGFTLSGEFGTPLIALRTERKDILEIEMNGQEVRIRFGAEHHFFRALGIVAERWHELEAGSGSILVTEYPQFETIRTFWPKHYPVLLWVTPKDENYQLLPRTA